MTDMTCKTSVERDAVWIVKNDAIEMEMEFDTDAKYVAIIEPFLAEGGQIAYSAEVMFKFCDAKREDEYVCDEHDVCAEEHDEFVEALASVYRHIANHYNITVDGENFCTELVVWAKLNPVDNKNRDVTR